MLEQIFLQLLNMSITGSGVILVVLLLRLLLKRVPKVFSYALWSVVLFRLLCPISFHSTFSLLPTNPNPISPDIIYAQIPRVDTGIHALDDLLSAALPAATPYASMNPIQGWVLLGELVWLLGVAVMLFYSVLTLGRLLWRLRHATPQEPGVWVASGLETPFVLGVIRPRIYMPEGLSETEQTIILLHERTHIRRFDPAVKLLSFLTLCLHWFNPLVWVAFSLSSKDMEMSCDERVIQTLGNDAKKEYSSSLLSLATGRRWPGGTPLAFGEGDTKMRIRNILRYKEPDFWVLAVVVLVVLVCIGLLANPPMSASSSGIIGSSQAPSSAQEGETAAEPAGSPSEVAFIQTFVDALQYTDGTVSMTIPPSIPTKRQLYIQVRGLMPIDEDLSNMSLHPFEQLELDAAWEAGHTYRETVFPEAPPNGTELTFDVYFAAEDGELMSSQMVRWVFQDGQPVVPFP